MAGAGGQRLRKGVNQEEGERKKNYMGKTHSKCRFASEKYVFCGFKQMHSWVEGCWLWCLWWAVLALTPQDVMVQWKMSCQLIEGLPVAAGRSVVTEAMCVNLLPCHFFCLASRLPFISTYFSFSLPNPRPPPELHSLYLVLCDKLLLAVDLLLVKSAPFATMKVGWAGRESAHPPPLHAIQSLSHSPPHTHVTNPMLRCLTGNWYSVS